MMANRNSCIAHPPKAKLLMIRDEYLAITEDDHCAAGLLAVFEHWHNLKLDNSQQEETDAAIAHKEGLEAEQRGGLWVYKTQADLQTDLLGLFGETKVSKAIKYIVEQGYVLVRSNPRYKWDRTPQYQFVPDAVQAAIAQNYVPPVRKNTEMRTQKHGVEGTKTRTQKREKTPAIPESLSETPSKTTIESERTRFPVFFAAGDIYSDGVRILNMMGEFTDACNAIFYAWFDVLTEFRAAPDTDLKDLWETNRTSVLALAKHRRTPEQVKDYMRHAYTDPKDDYWREPLKPITMRAIANNIGGWLAKPQPPNTVIEPIKPEPAAPLLDKATQDTLFNALRSKTPEAAHAT